MAEAWSESNKKMKDAISDVGKAFNEPATMAKTLHLQVNKEFGDLFNVCQSRYPSEQQHLPRL